MKKSLFLLGVASSFALTGCYGLLKSDYAKFKEQVREATKETPDFKQVKIRGTYDSIKVNLTYDIPNSLGSAFDSFIDGLTGTYNKGEAAGISIALGNKTPSSFILGDEGNDKYTYYTTLGFKVKTDTATYEWNVSGILASYKTNNNSFSFSWVKA